MRKETIGSATLYLGDCLTVLPTLGQADAVITDPPYGIGFVYESHDDSVMDYPQLLAAFLLLAQEKLTNGWMCVFQSESTSAEWHKWFADAWRLMAITKSFGQIGREQISRQTDYALYWKVGTPTWPEIGKHNTKLFRNWFHSSQASATAQRPDHPCPRPIDTMRYLVECFGLPRGTVLDPFMGSGTTGVACANLGRSFIGIEKEPKYFDVACERIENAQRQERLFA